MTETAHPPDRSGLPDAGQRGMTFRQGLTLIPVALAAGAGLFLAWQTAGSLLLIFAGLLFAALLDAAARGLAYVLPIGRGWRLTLVCLALALGTALLLVWGGNNLVQQAGNLIDLIGEQLRALRGELRARGIAPPPGSEGARTLTQLLLPDPGALFGQAYTAFSLASGLLGNAVVVVFIGLFAAASPETYGKASWRCCREPGGTASARSSTRWPERCARGWWANWRPWS